MARIKKEKLDLEFTEFFDSMVEVLDRLSQSLLPELQTEAVMIERITTAVYTYLICKQWSLFLAGHLFPSNFTTYG